MDVRIEEVVVFVDPFEEFLKEKGRRDKEVEEREKLRKMGGREDERVTWTGKRVRGAAAESEDGAAGVGKYLGAAKGNGQVLAEWESGEPVRKKAKAGGGFGNFDAW